jgi:hypothetical protein
MINWSFLLYEMVFHEHKHNLEHCVYVCHKMAHFATNLQEEIWL